jgi:hypothetical protein
VRIVQLYQIHKESLSQFVSGGFFFCNLFKARRESDLALSHGDPFYRISWLVNIWPDHLVLYQMDYVH